MSLLRSVLNKKKDPTGFSPGPSGKNKRSSAASFKSVASTIQSVASFYSTLTGSGPKVPKRRKPDPSKLGAPTFYHDNPPPSSLPEGVERVPRDESPFTAGHTTSAVDEEGKPFLTTVLFSHAQPNRNYPFYTNADCVTGEVRMVLDKPSAIESIEVWLVGKAESSLDIMSNPFLQCRARLWDSSFGDPSQPSAVSSEPFKQKVPAGTYVFPFSFPELPRDVHITQSEEAMRKNAGEVNVELPPAVNITSLVGGFAGQIRYLVGVNVIRKGFLDENTYQDTKFMYVPRTRPIPRPITDFPLLPTREDWPFHREEVGGWVLTPFGGRGRFNDEMVEIEGILGVQAPPVHSSLPRSNTVAFELLLWSTNPTVLRTMAKPEHIKVAFLKADVYGLDALAPRTGAMKNRGLSNVTNGEGKIWVVGGDLKDEEEEETFDFFADKGKGKGKEVEITNGGLGSIKESEEDEEEFQTLDLSSVSDALPESVSSSVSSESSPPVSRQAPTSPTTSSSRPARRSSLATSSFSASVEDEDDTSDSDSAPQPEATFSGSVAADDEDEFNYLPGQEEGVLRMKGEVNIGGAALQPSYRYQYMAREYFIRLDMTHPDYSHITPSGPSIFCETPVWITTNPARSLSSYNANPSSTDEITLNSTEKPEEEEQSPPTTSTEEEDLTYLSSLPVKGDDIVPITPDAHVWKRVRGERTREKRPTNQVQRLAAF